MTNCTTADRVAVVVASVAPVSAFNFRIRPVVDRGDPAPGYGRAIGLQGEDRAHVSGTENEGEGMEGGFHGQGGEVTILSNQRVPFVTRSSAADGEIVASRHDELQIASVAEQVGHRDGLGSCASPLKSATMNALTSPE